MAYLVNILLVSVILTLMAIPVMERLRKKGLSDFTSALLIALAACLCILLLVVIVFYSTRSSCRGCRCTRSSSTCGLLRSQRFSEATILLRQGFLPPGLN
jgi:hypothetical protein